MVVDKRGKLLFNYLIKFVAQSLQTSNTDLPILFPAASPKKKLKNLKLHSRLDLNN